MGTVPPKEVCDQRIIAAYLGRVSSVQSIMVTVSETLKYRAEASARINTSLHIPYVTHVSIEFIVKIYVV